MKISFIKQDKYSQWQTTLANEIEVDIVPNINDEVVLDNDVYKVLYIRHCFNTLSNCFNLLRFSPSIGPPLLI